MFLALPLDNNHLLTVEHVTLKTDDLANTIAVKGVKAVANLGTPHKEFFLDRLTTSFLLWGNPPRRVYTKY